MVKIRLKRMGAKKRPAYRIVVADSRSPRDGRFIEAIGFYDPLPNPPVVTVDADKVREWMRKGARPSESARYVLESQGVLPKSPRPVGQTVTPNGAADKASASTAAQAQESAVEVEAPAGEEEAGG